MLLTSLQYQRAWDLAHAHGHEWSNNFRRDDTGIPLEQIEWISEGTALWPNMAELRPKVGHSVVYHTSGRGRVRWIITADGRVNITIRRPGGAVLRFRVTAEDDVVIRTARMAGLYARHMEAAHDAIAALTGVKDAAFALKELWEAAKPDPVEELPQPIPVHEVEERKIRQPRRRRPKAEESVE